MNISLILTLSDGTQQVHSYALPEGLTLTGYTVDVNGFPVAAPVATDPVERLTRNAMYGKTGAGKTAVDQAAADRVEALRFKSAAACAALICGCNNADAHRGGLLDRAATLPRNVFLFTPRQVPIWPPQQQQPETD